MDDVGSRRFAAAAEQMQSAGFSDVEEQDKSLGDKASQALSKLRNGVQRVSALISSGRATTREIKQRPRAKLRSA